MNQLARRTLKFLAETGFWKFWGKMHTLLYRLTRGWLGHDSGGLTNLLLTTTGRKTGKKRTVPVCYVRKGEDYLVVASNGGADRPPAWWLNLETKPEAKVQVGFQKLFVRARTATAEEREQLWPMLKRENYFFPYHEANARREIAVVILSPFSRGPA